MIKKLMGSIREYKYSSILTSLFVVFEVILEILMPLVIADLIDNGVYKGSMNVIYKLGIELIIFALLALLFGVFAGRFAAKASTGFAKNLRKDLFYKVQDFSFSNIDRFSTSSLVTRLTTDVSNVQMAYQMVIRMAVRSPLMLIFALVMSFRIHKSLSLIFLITIPILGIGLYLIIKKVFPLMNKVFKTYDKLNNTVEENVRASRVVKSYVAEENEIEKFNNVSESIFNTFSKAEKILALNMPLLQGSIYLVTLLISWFGSQIIVNTNMSSLTTGELMTLFTYTIQILSSLMMLSMILVMIIISRASMKRIVEVLDEKVDINNIENPKTKIKNGDIVFKDVSFSYTHNMKKRVLKDINIEIKSGETIGIIGGTGSAKTTLVNLIPRLYDTTSGDVFVGGVNVKDYDIKILRDEVACVLQKNVLFSGTIIDNLKWGDESATLEDIKRVCSLSCADEFINQLPKKYNTYIEQGGTNLSGGQKQRLCIARALLKKPKILILDDSTSAVDTKTDSKIRQSFKNEIPFTTKIIIAQRIASVEESDKIIVMNKGRIESIGTHKELLKTNKIYKEVYNSQMKGKNNER